MKYYYCLILTTLWGCNLNISQDGSPGVSTSIADAKEKEVFTRAYALSKASKLITADDIAEVWLETPWGYRGAFSQVSYHKEDTIARNRLVVNLTETGSKKFRQRKLNLMSGDVGSHTDWDYTHVVSAPRNKASDTLLVTVIKFSGDDGSAVDTLCLVGK